MKLNELLKLTEDTTPEHEEFGEDLDDLIERGYAVRAWEIDTPFNGSDGAPLLIGTWLYEGYESEAGNNMAKKPKIVATVVETSGEDQNASPIIYDRKVTDKQALHWYVKEMKSFNDDDGDDDYGGGW